jgi:hypothetical protein
MKNIALALIVLSLVASAGRAGEDLGKKLDAVRGAESYSFSVRDNTGPGVDARYQKGQPLFCKADGIEFYRKAEVLVYKQGDNWQRTRTGTLSDPLRILGASAKVRAVRLPHEELAILGKALTTVKNAEGIVTGEFNMDAAKKLARTEDADLARGGSAKLWLDKKGGLVKYTINIRVQGKRGNADVDGVMTRTVTIADVGTAKVEIPAGAKKALN